MCDDARKHLPDPFQELVEENRRLREEVKTLKTFIDTERRRHRILDIVLFPAKDDEYVKFDKKMVKLKGELVVTEQTQEGKKLGIKIPCQ